jgi:hypothetical protein
MIDSCSCRSVLVGMLMLEGYSLCACSFILISSLHFKGVARNVSRDVIATRSVAVFGGSVIAVHLLSPTAGEARKPRLLP